MYLGLRSWNQKLAVVSLQETCFLILASCLKGQLACEIFFKHVRQTIEDAALQLSRIRKEA